MTFDALFVPAPLLEAVSERAWVGAMLDAERALANAESIAGVIPIHLAGPIAQACDVDGFDIPALVAEGRAAGNPAEPLVRALRTGVGGEAADFVHFGATSQDILDTAAMLVSRRALGVVDEELAGVADACAALAEAHRLTPMAARTLLQQAVPTTFGLKAAGWLVPVVRARTRLAELRRRLPSQLGGAAGTLAALGELEGTRVAAMFADELDLTPPRLPWHTDRSVVAELGAALAITAGACAKIGFDLALLEQTEVGEVREPAGEGGSSTMPQKRNPVGSALAVACARRVDAAAQTLLGGLVQEHERAVGTWHAEWGALSDALAYAGGAAAAARGALTGLGVDAGRMRANLDTTAGGVMSERVALVLARKVGRERAWALVSGALASGSLRDGLADELTEAELDDILDPAGYLGVAGELVDRALALYRDAK
jgi:3-carboxy-cis,cis-muconate cycloisomerase